MLAGRLPKAVTLRMFLAGKRGALACVTCLWSPVMPQSDWRCPAAYAYVSDLDPSGLAWEFLRRNPEYRREYRTVSEESQSNAQAEAFACRWGMRSCVAPDMPANKAALIWLPRINPANVLIAHTPGAFAGARPALIPVRRHASAPPMTAVICSSTTGAPAYRSCFWQVRRARHRRRLSFPSMMASPYGSRLRSAYGNA
jgi:hypothetical protein